MSQNAGNESDLPIDVVIAWVDGSDPNLAKKRARYLNKVEDDIRSSAVLPTHFASNNEIRYCLFSILRFAPFVRNIFIVTDGQDPDLNKEVEKYFPERLNTIRIVDHTEIFEGYEKLLPTFNSISIGNMVWRIKGLSDNFVYFNDDVILIREIKPEDWFINNRPVLRGKWLLPPLKKLLRVYLKSFFNITLKLKPSYQPRLSFHILQWKVAYMLGRRLRYFFLCHTPHPLYRKSIETFFSENRELMEENISYRFRSRDQLLMSSLAYHLEIKNGNRQFGKINIGYLHPNHSERRFKRRIRSCENDTSIKSVCVQSLDLSSDEEQQNMFDWLDMVLNLKTR